MRASYSSPGSVTQPVDDCSTRETPPVKKMQGFLFGLQSGQGHGLDLTSVSSLVGGCCHWDLPSFLHTARASSHQACSHLSRSRHLVLVRLGQRKSACIRQRPTTTVSLQPPPLTFHLHVGQEKGLQKLATKQGAKGPLNITARRCLLREC